MDLRLSLASGPILTDGATYNGRTNVELLSAWRASRLLRLDLVAALATDAPLTLALRPGLRLFTGPVGWRLALQWMTAVDGNPDLHAFGAILGVGGEWDLSQRLFLAVELDASLLFTAISVVPVEARLGLGIRYRSSSSASRARRLHRGFINDTLRPPPS